jgi:hypothetical protein
VKATKIITRRDFLRGTAGLLILGGLTPSLASAAGQEAAARVVVVRNEGVLNPGGDINAPTLQAMLDDAVKFLTGEGETGKAWGRLFRSSDVVGVKTNAWYHLPTPPQLESAIQSRLLEVGIEKGNVSIDDRGVLDNPVFSRATALVNVRPLRTHHWSGMGSCIKNYIMFVRTPSAYHGEGCSELGKIWTLPLVKGKTRLNILAALTPQFYGRGANFFDRRYVWPYKGLIVGTDPVAVDAVGAELLAKKRITFFGEDRPLDVAPVHIGVADKKYKLGVSDLSRVEIVKIGWKEAALV